MYSKIGDSSSPPKWHVRIVTTLVGMSACEILLKAKLVLNGGGRQCKTYA